MLVRFLLLCTTAQLAASAKILFYFAFSSYSHRIAVWPLVESLAERGHRIHFLSPYPPLEENPNVTEIHPPGLVDLLTAGSGNIVERRLDRTYEKIWNEIRETGIKACEATFGDEKTREFLVETHFDLLIIDSLYNECGIGLAYKYGSPFILFGTGSPHVWQGDTHGFFPETSWIPDITKDYPLAMTFLQRVYNTLNPIYWHFSRHWYDFPEMDRVLHEALGIRKMPPLEELEKNASLVLQNSHFSAEFPRSLPPLYVPIGGMHCEKGRKIAPLTEEIEEFVNETEEGFIYISFGSAMRFSLMKEPFQKIFFTVLASFEHIRFVWKWDGSERPEKMPANVLTVNWVPQQALLAHPKIRAFISHAGLLSVQEAITYAVPLIVMPIYADQNYNAEKVARQGYGIRLEISRLKKEGLSDAISNILNEPKYTEKAASMSALFADRPMKPLETAVWWTEYILRHGSGKMLRPMAQSQNWLQRRALDVYAFLLSLVFFLLLVLYILMRQAIMMLLAYDEDDYEEEEERKKRKKGRKEDMETLMEVDEGSESENEEGEFPPVTSSNSSPPRSPMHTLSRPGSPTHTLSRPGSPGELDPEYVKSKDA